MRKQYKKKLRSCKICKLHKRGITNRWNTKELFKLKLFEKEKREYA